MFFENMGVFFGFDCYSQAQSACSERIPITLIHGFKTQTAKLSQNFRLSVWSALKRFTQPKAPSTAGRSGHIPMNRSPLLRWKSD